MDRILDAALKSLKCWQSECLESLLASAESFAAYTINDVVLLMFLSPLLIPGTSATPQIANKTSHIPGESSSNVYSYYDHLLGYGVTNKLSSAGFAEPDGAPPQLLNARAPVHTQIHACRMALLLFLAWG